MAQRSVFVVFDLDAMYVRAERLTIDHDEVFIVSDGSMTPMMKFVKEMLIYDPDFRGRPERRNMIPLSLTVSTTSSSGFYLMEC